LTGRDPASCGYAMPMISAVLFALLVPVCQDVPVKVAGGFGFVEGPAWDPVGNRLLFSDIGGNKILELTGRAAKSFLDPSERANGLAFDDKGNLYACQGGARRLVRIAPNGQITVLVSRFEGKRLNSPNDLALDEHGGIYFTDPRYGRADDLEQDVMGVYYVSQPGKIVRVIDELDRPNGIAVSRDGSGLYVAHPDTREVWFYPILAPGKLGRGRVLFTGDPKLDGGGPDGMAIDEDGNLYASYSGIVVLTAGGKLIERIPVPERPANCTFGGRDKKTLYITARTSLYRVERKRRGQDARPALGSRRKPSARVAVPRFERKVIDAEVKIGYGVAVADVDGDKREDIVLVDRDVIAWYRNGDFSKHVIARRLTKRDHVCVAARDIDGDGRCEIAVGGEWNPGDTNTSGSVHWLVAPDDRRTAWKPVRLPNEPTVHRMRWLDGGDGGFSLIVAPLHGRGNRAGVGAGVKIQAYERNAGDWKITTLDDSLHQTHNIDPVQWDDDPAEELLVAGREGLFVLDHAGGKWSRTAIAGSAEGDPFAGASEVRLGRRSGGGRFVAAIEPFHGNQLVVYRPAEPGSPRRLWRRRVLDASLAQGHAVACGDVLGTGNDQIVVGWRKKNAAGKVGIKIYVPRQPDLSEVQEIVLDERIACEDLRLADLDGDGRLDIVAAGRASHDLVVWFNRLR